jgi:hypothetical protein
MPGRRSQTPDVAVVEERNTVVSAEGLVNALPVEESVIVNGDNGLIGAADSAVDVHRSAHVRMPPGMPQIASHFAVFL